MFAILSTQFYSLSFSLNDVLRPLMLIHVSSVFVQINCNFVAMAMNAVLFTLFAHGKNTGAAKEL